MLRILKFHLLCTILIVIVHLIMLQFPQLKNDSSGVFTFIVTLLYKIYHTEFKFSNILYTVQGLGITRMGKCFIS